MLSLADTQGRLLVSFDKDFGDPAVRRRLRASGGIVLFRLETVDPDETARRLVRVLKSGSSWEGRFSVVTARLTRQRPLAH